MQFKIAFVTDDGKTISAHYGMARYFLVVDYADGKIAGSEMRAKAFHESREHAGGHDKGPADSGGMHSMRDDMLSVVKDCGIVVAGGMGRPMYDALTASGKHVYVTRISGIDAAIEAYGQGNLDNQTNRIHLPH